jgi:hypothetical protein
MVAKSLFDRLKGRQRRSLRGVVKQLVPSLLISPVVFLGFIKTADLGIQGDWGLMVLFLFAFQNGFFWQDVLTMKLSAEKVVSVRNEK